MFWLLVTWLPGPGYILFLLSRTGPRDEYSCSRRLIVGHDVADAWKVLQFLQGSLHRFRKRKCMGPRGLMTGGCTYTPIVPQAAHLAISLRRVVS